MAKKKPSNDDRIHGRSREVKHVVKQMSDVDFFDYRLVVRSSGIQELNHGHTGLRQGLVHVENVCEDLRAGNYGMAHSNLLRSLQIFEQSHNQIRRALVELGEYYDDHPTEVREINHGLTEMCDGCDCLVKSLVSLRQTKTGESLEMGRRALTHLREAAHRIGSHLRDIKDCCPSNVEFEVMDIRENEARTNGGIEGARPVEMVSCHSTHGPGEPCNQTDSHDAVSKNQKGKADDSNPADPADPSNQVLQSDQKIQNAKALQLNMLSQQIIASNSGKEKRVVDEQGDSSKDSSEENVAAQVARMQEQLEDKHVPLDKVAEAVESVLDPSEVADVPLLSRDFKDESAIEDLMRVVSENRSRTIDRLVADARAAKAGVIADTNHVPVPGEETPGLKAMNTSKKSSKKTTKKELEKVLEKAKETANREPRKWNKSEDSPEVVKLEKKPKQEEIVSELNFDDADLDTNKAAKKKV